MAYCSITIYNGSFPLFVSWGQVDFIGSYTNSNKENVFFFRRCQVNIFDLDIRCFLLWRRSLYLKRYWRAGPPQRMKMTRRGPDGSVIPNR